MSDCGVCIGGEGEPIEDYDIGVVTAKWAYRCSECGRSIPAGVEHEQVTGSYEGTIINRRTCIDCRNIAEGLSCEWRVHGALWTDLEGTGPGDKCAAFSNFNQGCITKIKTVQAKQYPVSRWLAWKGLGPPDLEPHARTTKEVRRSERLPRFP